MNTSYIKYEIIDNRISHVIINRPGKLNAFTLEMYKEFINIILKAEDDDTVVTLLTSEGRAFSAGADLSILEKFLNMEVGGLIDTLETMYRASQVIYDHSKPVITAVQGYAIGSGFGIALASDILILSKDAILRPGFTALGLNPEFFTSITLPIHMGYKNAIKKLLLNEDINAEEAYRFGIAQYIVDKEKLFDTALSIARKISTNPRYMNINTKRLLKEVYNIESKRIIELEALLQAENILNIECRDKIRKFLDSIRKK